MSLLAALSQTGTLRPIDLELAATLKRLDPATPDLVLAAAALASFALTQGHSGFNPGEPEHLIGAPIDWPTPQHWREQLTASPWAATPAATEPAAPAPLVLEYGLIYLRRYREYERQLGSDLTRIASALMPEAVPKTLSTLFTQLFPADTRDAQQARAAALALESPLLLLTGGPGTGKTTTIARLLILRIAQSLALHQTAPRIALAAPTGRAAERMAESLRRAAQQFPQAGIEPALCAHLPLTGSTLHRLLGPIPDSPHFRHNAQSPLPYDIVVIDEASMLDLALTAKLVAAIASGSQLILLGDPEQLPAVDPGDVLRGLVQAAESDTAPGKPRSHSWERGWGEGAAEAADITSGNVARKNILLPRIHLQRSYRQQDTLNLAPLAEAVRAGDSARALALLRSGELCGVHFHEHDADPLVLWHDPLHHYWRAMTQADTPAHALSNINHLRILTAVRDGPQGANTLNARIEHMLRGRSHQGSAYFHGRLVMVTENSPRQQLYNGDLGVCLQEGSALRAWFPGDDPETPRPFHPAALPAHESAFAMTIHKAQGAEFADIWLQLPQISNRILTRELLYTGLTRARRAVHLTASSEVITSTLSRQNKRWSGLAQRW